MSFKLLKGSDIPDCTNMNSNEAKLMLRRMLVGNYLQSNCGEVYKVVEYETSKRIRVFFIFSNVERVVQLYSVKTGGVAPFKTNRRVAGMPIGTSLSREEWMLACKQAHGDKYDYTDTIFGKHDEVIEVRCKHHNLKFRTRLTRHANGRGSCPSCAYDGQKTPFSKWVSGVDDMTNYCTKTIEPLDEWAGVGNSKVVVKCCHGGEEIRRAGALKHVEDCLRHRKKVEDVLASITKEAAYRHKWKEKLKTHYDQQYREIVEWLGDGYEVDYEHIKQAIQNGERSKALNFKLKHSCGHEWERNYGELVRTNYGKGSGCPLCASWGYSYKDGSYLYLLTSTDGMFKVGITKDIDQRVRQINKRVGGVDTGRTWNLFWCRKLEGDLRPVEKSIKEYLDTCYSKPSVRFDGFTESYVLGGKSIPLPFILSAVNF